MLYHNDTTAETYEAAASPVSFVGDVVDPTPLRAALDQAASLVELCDSELLASFTHLEQASRLVDALKLRLFQEIAERSPSDGPSLARDHGHKDAIDLLVRLTGSSRQDVRARLELAAVLPVPEPAWATPEPSSSSDATDSTDPGSSDSSSDLPPPGDDTGPIAEALFSYVEKGIRSGELPEKTAIKIKQEITKFQKETTNTTPEQILHAEKLLVAKAIGAEIPDDPTTEFVLDFDFGVTPPGTSSETPGAPGAPDTPGSSGSSDDSGAPGASGDTTPPTPAPPVRPSRPNLPVPSDNVGREARNVITKIAPTSRRVERAQLDRRSVKFGREYQGLVRVEARVVPEVAALMQRAFDVLLSPRTTPTEDLGKTGTFGESAAFGDAGTRVNSTANGVATPNRNTTSGTSKGAGVRFTKTITTTNPDGTSIDGDTNTGLTITDDRTPEQKRHDAFATLMEAALKAGHLPQTANGAATLVVTISEEELDKPDGTGRMIDHFGKETPVTSRTARHTACNGKVLLMKQTRKGKIVELENLQRVFTEHQRKAIIARDGGCVIPGCEVPAGWCEIHHVIPWTENQVTDVSNGVALCWWHHRTIETSGWDIRMRDGVPEIKAPPGIDPEQLWRPARPRIPEHAIVLNRETAEPEPFDWGAILTEEPF